MKIKVNGNSEKQKLEQMVIQKTKSDSEKNQNPSFEINVEHQTINNPKSKKLSQKFQE